MVARSKLNELSTQNRLQDHLLLRTHKYVLYDNGPTMKKCKHLIHSVHLHAPDLDLLYF